MPSLEQPPFVKRDEPLSPDDCTVLFWSSSTSCQQPEPASSLAVSTPADEADQKPKPTKKPRISPEEEPVHEVISYYTHSRILLRLRHLGRLPARRRNGRRRLSPLMIVHWLSTHRPCNLNRYVSDFLISFRKSARDLQPKKIL